jgi:hypothetical protein
VNVASKAGKFGSIWAPFLLAVIVSCVLNFDSIFVRDLYIWPRFAIPACLFVGLSGAFWKNQILFIFMSALAWIGTGFFVLLAITSIVPGELIRATDNPQGPSGMFLAARFCILAGIGIMLAVTLARWQRAWWRESHGQQK